MSAVLTSTAAAQPAVAFELDGQPVTAHPGETILKAAQRHGVEIPHLCYTDGLRPDGNCRIGCGNRGSDCRRCICGTAHAAVGCIS